MNWFDLKLWRVCALCTTSFIRNHRSLFCLECRPLHRRFKALFKILKADKIEKTDPLWNIRYYYHAILRSPCHYCGGRLPVYGHSLDRKDNRGKHTANNVVPCCTTCNTKKGAWWGYEEFLELKPVLTKQRLRCGRT
jgi:hypothetical protein